MAMRGERQLRPAQQTLVLPAANGGKEPRAGIPPGSDHGSAGIGKWLRFWLFEHCSVPRREELGESLDLGASVRVGCDQHHI